MSSFYDDASLVVIPSGYKTSKVYAEKPTDGSGDLAFTRTGDTATRVNSAGLIEKVRTNLVLQSQTFDNASWNKTTDGQVTITANAAAAPDGTTTAEKMIPSAIAGFHCVAQTITLSAGEVTISVFAKAAENSFLQIFDSLTTDFANFNLTTGVVGSTDAYVASIQSAGNGWFRCTATKVVPSGSFALRYGVVTTATAVRGESFTGNGTDGLLIWGAQAEQGVATSYIPTTTAAVSVGPVANVPRLDYLGSTCPRLILEGQRTNLALYSEQFNNSHWVKYLGATVTSNTITSPDGNTNADTLNTSAGQEIYATMTSKAASAIIYTFSCFAKYNNAAVFQLVASDFATSATIASFNLQTGVATFAQGASWSNTSVKMENYGNGWWRCIMTSTSPTTTGLYASLLTSTTGSVYIYGMQCEQAAYATSYIPTLAASATRGADGGTTSIPSLVNASEGVLFLEYTPNNIVDAFPVDFQLQYNGSSAVNGVTIFHAYATPSVTIRSGSAVVASFSGTAVAAGAVTKIAVAYKANDFVMYQNGILIGTYTSGNAPVDLNEIRLSDGSRHFSINQALLFPTRLSNASLAELTTL